MDSEGVQYELTSNQMGAEGKGAGVVPTADKFGVEWTVEELVLCVYGPASISVSEATGEHVKSTVVGGETWREYSQVL